MNTQDMEVIRLTLEEIKLKRQLRQANDEISDLFKRNQECKSVIHQLMMDRATVEK